MGMKMSETPKNFYSTTKVEILGAYKPGKVPVVYGYLGYSADSTHIHERGHQRLCDNTSIGLLTKILSLASDLNSTPYKDLVNSALNECLKASWFCQEGHAVWQQLVHALLDDDVPQFESIIKALPLSYKSAISSFDFDIAEIHANLPPNVTSHEKNIYTAVILDTAVMVLSYAAMSPPIVDSLLDGAEPLPISLIKSLRKNAPDKRLEKLVGEFKLADFIQWHIKRDVNQSRPLKDQLVIDDELVKLVCERTGIAYENANNMIDFLPTFWESLNSSRKLTVHHSLEDDVVQNLAKQGGNYNKSQLILFPNECDSMSTLRAWLVRWFEFAKSRKHIITRDDARLVIEVLYSSNEIFKIAIHTFTRFRGFPESKAIFLSDSVSSQLQNMNVQLDNIVNNLNENAALPSGSLLIDASEEELCLLSENSPCPVSWIIDSNEYNTCEVYQKLESVTVCDYNLHSWKLEGHLTCFNAVGYCVSAAFFDVTYLHYYIFDMQRKVSFARVGSDQIGNVKSKLTFEQGCLIETSVSGLMVQLID
tara:strand:- start:1681 stop:3288 length:1608 start_codon:yes stop_codon:yes gene_type:complete